MKSLPIDEVIPELRSCLQVSGSAILIAEPGAGKTTRTPLELLKEPWLGDQGILLLEPRRLAARSAASYMSKELGERVGDTVGYRIRNESRVSNATRITVVTEGILTRMIQQDPALIGTGLIIFDEFHERSIHADLGLALALQSRLMLREDLRILIMSATLDSSELKELVQDAPVVQSKGRIYPVTTHHFPMHDNERIENTVVRAVGVAVTAHKGNLLVFLPGVREIRRVEELLKGSLPGDLIVTPLYGALTQEQQQRAIEVAPQGKRKIVLSTSIAESSLTVDGVTVVIDSGLRRSALFSARTGMNRLVTTRVARDSADQRRGRAGRTAPGICYRLWSEAEDRMLLPQTPPEILEADMAPLALEVAAWGAASPKELNWLTPPPEGPYQQAVELLIQLGALDNAGVITAYGRRMAALGLHPRLAHMLYQARRLGLLHEACLLAAMLEERDLFQGTSMGRDVDLRSRLELLMQLGESTKNSEGDQLLNKSEIFQTRYSELQRLETISRQWERRISELADGEEVDLESRTGKSGVPRIEERELYCGLLISFAYPDRIARRRPDGRYVLANGRGAAFPFNQILGEEAYLAIAEVDDMGPEGRILLAAPLREQDLTAYHSDRIQQLRTVQWDQNSGGIRVRVRTVLGAIVLKDIPDPSPSQEDITKAVLGAVEEHGVAILSWDKKARELQSRIQFLRKLKGHWPDVSDENLSASPEEWLAPYVTHVRKRADLESLNLASILESMLDWHLLQELNCEAPAHLIVPSGSKIKIHYDGAGAPYAAVRLQELFGMLDTPMLGYHQIPLTFHLLSPAARPVQVTSDLRSFWEHTYFEVKKDLKGRYPKHYWPDNPMQAIATRKVRPDKA